MPTPHGNEKDYRHERSGRHEETEVTGTVLCDSLFDL